MSAILTPEVIADIMQILSDHHRAIGAAVWGKGAVSKGDWDMAAALGLVDVKDPEGIMSGLHEYGALLAHLDQSTKQDRYGMTAEEFVAEVRRNPVPQTRLEEKSAEEMQRRGATLIAGLGNMKGAKVGSALIEADGHLADEMRDTIRDVISARSGSADAAQRLKDRGADQALPDDVFDDAFRGSV